MKVILTEAQFNILCEIEETSLIIKEILNEGKRMGSFKKTIRRLLYTGVALTSIIAAINKLDISNNEKEILIQTTIAEDNIINSDEVKAEDVIQKKIFDEKVESVKAYMEYALKNQGFTLESTGLKPETLVRVSMETNFDLPFIMAVAHQESCFGATARAKRSNSIFSEGAYDNGKDVVRYSDPNDSVMGFVKLLNKSYLVNGKTIFDLMKPGCFVNGVGNRYASDKKYENKIKGIRNRIIKMYPNLQ